MISENEYRNYKEKGHFKEPRTIKKECKIEKIYEIIEYENIYDIFPTYDLQDEELTQDILEVYKIIFWGASAIASTLLWLYFFLM